MLGKIVKVNFDCINSNVLSYKGKVLCNCTVRLIFDGKAELFTAYFLGDTSPDTTSNNIMINAILEYKTHQRLFVTPKNVIYFEPEITDIVEKLNIKTPLKIKCSYEKSCGAVVYRWVRNKPMFLLIKNMYARYWSFPKGHIEKNESEHGTAKREIAEETGLCVKFIRGFRQCCTYSPYANVSKQVVLFLAEANEGQVVIQEEEIEKYTWADCEEAIKMCKHKNDKKVLKLAYARVIKLNNQTQQKQLSYS